MFHRPRDEESANAKNLQNIIPHTGYGAVNLETRETVCSCVRGQRCTENKKVQFRHFLIEQFRQDADISLVSRGFIPIPQLIKLPATAG